MKLTTSRGNEYDVLWAGESLGRHGVCLVQMTDARRLPEIAAEFDGLEGLKTGGQPGQTGEALRGYTRLTGITRIADGNVLITLEKE